MIYLGETVEKPSIAKNLLEKRVCDKCKYSTIRDKEDEGYKLHCTNEDFLYDPHYKWGSHVVPTERTCKYWEKR